MVSDILSALSLKHFSQCWRGDTNEYALHYVDDLVFFFKTFEEHLATVHFGRCEEDGNSV
jgi:hypothetical protein